MKTWFGGGVFSHWVNDRHHLIGSSVNSRWHDRTLDLPKSVRKWLAHDLSDKPGWIAGQLPQPKLGILETILGHGWKVSSLKSVRVNCNSFTSDVKFSMMSKVREELIRQHPAYLTNIDCLFNKVAYSFDEYHAGKKELPQKLFVLWGDDTAGAEKLCEALGSALVDDKYWFRSIQGGSLLFKTSEETRDKFRRLLGIKRPEDFNIEFPLPFRILHISDFDRCMIVKDDKFTQQIKVLRSELQLFLTDKNYGAGNEILIVATTKKDVALFPCEIIREGTLGFWSEVSRPSREERVVQIDFFVKKYIGEHELGDKFLSWFAGLMCKKTFEEIDLFCKKLALDDDALKLISQALTDDDWVEKRRILRDMVSDPLLVEQRKKKAMELLKINTPFIGLESFRKKLDVALHQLNEICNGLGQSVCWIVSGNEGAGRTTFCYKLIDELSNFDGFEVVVHIDAVRFVRNNYCATSIATLENIFHSDAINTLFILDDADCLVSSCIPATQGDIAPVEFVKCWKSFQDASSPGKNVVLVLVVKEDNARALLDGLSGVYVAGRTELASCIKNSDINDVLTVKKCSEEGGELLKQTIAGQSLSVKYFMRMVHHCIDSNGRVDREKLDMGCGLLRSSDVYVSSIFT